MRKTKQKVSPKEQYLTEKVNNIDTDMPEQSINPPEYLTEKVNNSIIPKQKPNTNNKIQKKEDGTLNLEHFAKLVSDGQPLETAYLNSGGTIKDKWAQRRYAKEIANRPYVRDLIASLSTNISDPTSFTNTAIESLYINRARASISDIMEWDKGGKSLVLKGSSELDRDVASRIASIKTDYDRESGTTYIKEVKLYDPQPYANRLTEIRSMVKKEQPAPQNTFNIKNLLIDASSKNQSNLKTKVKKQVRIPEVEILTEPLVSDNEEED